MTKCSWGSHVSAGQEVEGHLSDQNGYIPDPGHALEICVVSVSLQGQLKAVCTRRRLNVTTP